jgi:TnpA family transposase
VHRKVAITGTEEQDEDATVTGDARIATSIRTGTTTSSAMLKKLSAYPRQNGLAKALREVGLIERSSARCSRLIGSRTRSSPICGIG